jgi:hypothetical protein
LQELQQFSLVGGTALALKYGHRKSVDLDLFSNEDFDKTKILDSLSKEFGNNFSYEGSSPNWAVFCYIENIKTDIIKYNHPLIVATEVEESIKMYHSKDILAMKVNAILGRGKKKDFWDIYELLHHFSLDEMIKFYYQKFPKQMLLISIPEAITYFADAEESEDPVSLKGQTWSNVKKFIQQKVSDYLR